MVHSHHRVLCSNQEKMEEKTYISWFGEFLWNNIGVAGLNCVILRNEARKIWDNETKSAPYFMQINLKTANHTTKRIVTMKGKPYKSLCNCN